MTGRSGTLWQLTRGYRHYYAASIAALAVATIVAYIVPLVSRAAIDAIFSVHLAESEAAPAPGGVTTGAPGIWRPLGDTRAIVDRLWLPALVIAGLAAFSAAFTYLKGRWAAIATEGVVQQLRDRLCDQLNHLPAAYHDQAETGDLVQRCTSDVETVRHFLALQVVEVGRAVLLLLTVVPLMLWLDPRMTAVSLAGVPVIVAFSISFFLKVKPTFQHMDEAEGRMTTVLQENLTGIRVVRAFARQAFECSKFDVANADYRRRHLGLIKLLAIYWTCSDFLVLMQQTAVLLTGAYFVRTGQLSVGTLVAFLALVTMFIYPVRQMGRILADLGKAAVAMSRIQEILDEEPELDAPMAEGANGIRLPEQCRGEVVFDHVSFGYAEQSQVLHDVSFRVEPGQTLAILGPSGAGKSTVVSLLLRLYDGASGSLLLDGHPIDRLPRKWVRRQIAVVMQEPFLYSKTVRENIRLGRREAEERELQAAASAAAIHSTIDTFEQGYETLVGERGVTLSGGQRQRIVLARALLSQPAVLVLDDALSAVDTSTETLILQALRQRRGRQTTIVIAHRISTLRQADRILVLDRGRVAQYGTHDELLSQEGLYRRLYRLQEGPQAQLTSESCVPSR